MLIYEHDLSAGLLAWPSNEERIFHLYELDPTHVAAQAGDHRSTPLRRASLQTPAASPFCLLAEQAHPAVLLELDPTHSQGPEAQLS